MGLISTEGYTNAGVRFVKIKKTGEYERSGRWFGC